MTPERVINIGDIYSIALTRADDVTPKGPYDSRRKYCFILGFTEYGYYVAYFLMNSHINSNFINTHDLLSCQYPLSMSDYPEIIVPEKDPSYLDLGHIRVLESQRLKEEGEYKGTLTPKDKETILNWLRKSEQYSTKEKKKYGWLPCE